MLEIVALEQLYSRLRNTHYLCLEAKENQDGCRLAQLVELVTHVHADDPGLNLSWDHLMLVIPSVSPFQYFYLNKGTFGSPKTTPKTKAKVYAPIGDYALVIYTVYGIPLSPTIFAANFWLNKYFWMSSKDPIFQANLPYLEGGKHLLFFVFGYQAAVSKELGGATQICKLLNDA